MGKRLTQGSVQCGKMPDVLAGGLQSEFMIGDNWYSCVHNLKTVKKPKEGVYVRGKKHSPDVHEKRHMGEGAKTGSPRRRDADLLR